MLARNGRKYSTAARNVFRELRNHWHDTVTGEQEHCDHLLVHRYLAPASSQSLEKCRMFHRIAAKTPLYTPLFATSVLIQLA